MPFDSMLKDRVALVTGSSRGIGWAIAQQLAAAGASVVLNGRSADALEARAEHIRRTFDVPCSIVAADVSEETQVKEVFHTVFATYKRLDVLVNNAGILEDALVGMIPGQMIDRVLGVNVKGSICALQQAARLMLRNRSGSIINVTSIAGTNGNAGQTVYSASKAALIGLTRSAAKELAPHQIRVNAVAPGFIDTDMIRQLPQAIRSERIASIRMGRIGTADDVAKVVLFLASDLAGYVTGQVIGVDGGMIL